MNTFPTHRASAYIVTHEKSRVVRKRLGSMLIPNGFCLEQVDVAILRKFKDANTFRLRDNCGQIVASGCLR